MSPSEIRRLADLADPDQLWRLSVFDQRKLTPAQCDQLRMGVMLRRHADYIQRLQEIYVRRKSLLITPLSPEALHTATKVVDHPPRHDRHYRTEDPTTDPEQ